MAIDITHDKDKDILVVTVIGELSLASLKAAAQQIISSDEYAANIAALWDLRQMDTSNINQDFFKNLIALREKRTEREGAKLALVANSDLKFGLSRMYEMLSDDLPQSMHVFRTIDEARNWLDSNSES